ncbi:MAG: radical SAM protein [Dysgonamonadaceae bacterium]|jgi:uncharacterized protein|nr:radical SAM protein [Dysgonamonadaceae bacterium]
MIWSRYNYLFKSKNFGFLLYNSLSNAFIELDEESYLRLKKVQEGEDSLLNNLDFYEKLVEFKILVESDKDEFYNIKYATHFNRFHDKYLELTINPTLNCNFACNYCFEGEKPSKYMTDEVENAIIDYIKLQDKIKNMHITWFGGEPLLAFNRISSLTEKIKEINTNFTASIITNGYLLSEKIIDKFDEYHIKKIQITIDGLAQTHNKRRPLISGEGTFEKIVRNIDLLYEKKPDFPVVIRVNVDETNQSEFVETFKYFYERYKGKNYVVPGFVDDITGCNISDCILDRNRKVQFLMKLYKEHNLNIFGFYPLHYRYECPVRNPHHFVIGPEGEIYKCWNDVGNSKKVIGNLLKKRVENATLLTRYFVAGDPFDDTNCVNCFHLPVCGGGCPHSRLAREFDNIKIDTCDNMKDNIEEFLELHYDYKQKTLQHV